MDEKKKLLLHVCCAPCATGCFDQLNDREITLFYSNSNLATKQEYQMRLDAVIQLAETLELDLMVDDYNHEDWIQAVSKVVNYPNMPERGLRCHACFQYSLGRAAQLAAELEMNFTTTLTVSPYKDNKMIFGVCAQYPNFEPYDFKQDDGYRKSVERSNLAGYYRQKFCGCEFSLRDYLRRQEEHKKTKLHQVF